MKFPKLAFLTLLVSLGANTIAQTSARAEQTNYTYQIAYCVGTVSATAWIGNNVVVMIEGETPADREPRYMDSLLTWFDAMEGKYMEVSGQYDLPLASEFDGKPVIEIVNDNCGAGGLASHGVLGMSTGKYFLNEVYNNAKAGGRALHQVFLYETNRNFWHPDFNNKFDWAMNNNDENYGWWTVGMNNAQAVMVPASLGLDLLYYGQNRQDFRDGMHRHIETYLNEKIYSFEYGWNQSLMPWRDVASINDLMSGLLIYSFENFGGDEWLKGFYTWIKSDEIINRSDVFAYQECRDNVYKVWSMAAKQDLRNFFEVDLRWEIGAEAKAWVDEKFSISLSAPGRLTGYAENNQILLSWQDNSNNENNITIERSTDGVNFSLLKELAADSENYIDADISAGTEYTYRIQAKNTSESSAYSNEITLNNTFTKPEIPDNISGSGISATEILVDWDAVSDVDGYIIQQEIENQFVQIGGTSSENLEFHIKDLANPNSNYTIRMASLRNNILSEFSDPINVTTLDVIPNKPRRVEIDVLSSNSLYISWSDESNNEDGFNLSRKEGSGQWKQISDLGENVTEYTDSELKASTTYTYKVRTYNEAGKSDYSKERAENTAATNVSLDLNGQISVYPNPAKELLNVSNPSQERLEVCIYNMLGQEIMKHNTNNSISQIPISNLGKGMYILQIKNASETLIKNIQIL